MYHKVSHQTQNTTTTKEPEISYKWVLTDKHAWWLLGDLDAERPWGHWFLLEAVNRDVGFLVKVLVSTTQISSFWVLIGWALVAFYCPGCKDGFLASVYSVWHWLLIIVLKMELIVTIAEIDLNKMEWSYDCKTSQFSLGNTYFLLHLFHEEYIQLYAWSNNYIMYIKIRREVRFVGDS